MSLNLPKRLKGQHASVKRSRVQEAKTARALGGRVTKASGSGEFEKGDVRLQRVARIECKTTQKRSFSINAEMLEKIAAHALEAGEIPAIEVEFQTTSPREGDTEAYVKAWRQRNWLTDDGAHRVAVIPMWALEMLLGGYDGIR